MNKYQEQAKNCKCVGKHIPLPTKLQSFNGVELCPTTYYNVLEYQKMWQVLGSEPPGSVRKHFSEYVQELVKGAM